MFAAALKPITDADAAGDFPLNVRRDVNGRRDFNKKYPLARRRTCRTTPPARGRQPGCPHCCHETGSGRQPQSKAATGLVITGKQIKLVPQNVAMHIQIRVVMGRPADGTVNCPACR